MRSGSTDANDVTNPTVVPLVLRVANRQALDALNGSTSSGDDALPTAILVRANGIVLAGETKITEVRTETTDDD